MIECHKNAPSPQLANPAAVFALFQPHWPLMQAMDWCGDWQMATAP